MHRLLLVLLVTTGAVSLNGCGFFNRGGGDDVVIEDATIQTEQANQSAEPAAGNLPNLPQGEDADTVVTVSSNPPTVVARDLIQSTDPNERTISVERTRQDPFADLTIPLVPPQPIEVEETGTTAARAQPAGGGQAGTRAAATRVQGNGTAANTSASQERPGLAEPRQVESDRPEIAELPEIPQPTTARAVRVSGVIQVGGSPYAIVQAPDENERYVRQGERIAGGRVFVKRIDTRLAEPRVILVENGIEVERFVTAASESETTEEVAPAETVSTIGALPALPTPGI